MTISATLSTDTANLPGQPVTQPGTSISDQQSQSQSPFHATSTSPSQRKMSRSSQSHTNPTSPPPSGYRSPGNKSKSMKRGLSHGSSGSAGTSAALRTPTTGNMPLSPDAPGSGTPKARMSSLVPAGEDVEMDNNSIVPPSTARAISTSMEELKMRSPDQARSVDPKDVLIAECLDRPSLSPSTKAKSPPARRNANGVGKQSDTKLPHRQWTSSTESSDSIPHPFPISQTGSMYNAEGFSQAPGTYSAYGFTGPRTDSPELGMTPAAAAAVAAADEAVKQLNGTSTVYQGPLPSGLPPPPDNPYQLPRGFANFVRPQQRSVESGVTRQSSMSSNTTEASTSSEEEDLCVPSIEWVHREREREREQGNAAAAGWLYGQPQGGQQNGQSAGRMQAGRSSPQKMPPPSTTRFKSPRLMGPPSGTNQQYRPEINQHYGSPGPIVGGGGGGPPQTGSALPIGIAPNAPNVDDDDITVGQPDRSSSASSQSGLDLLWRAVTHDSASESPREDRDNVRPAGGDVDFDHAAHGLSSTSADPISVALQVQEAKGKRKAGAEAVAQWRQSGIPLGVGPGRIRRESTNSTEPPSDSDRPEHGRGHSREYIRPDGQVIMSPPPHKRRRKSSAQTDLAQSRRDSRGTGGDGSARSGAYASQYQRDSRDVSADPDWESEPDDGESEGDGDSEYDDRSGRAGGGAGNGAGAGARRGGVPGTVSGTRIRKPSAKSRLAFAGNSRKPAGSKAAAPRASVGSAKSASASGGGAVQKTSAAKRGSTTAGSASPSKSAGGAGAGGAGSASGSTKGAAKSAPIPSHGVQCEYVNPLPPYNRCQDIFTRKYDLPRHMARHARREGELVLEGKLAENKATLWATIKDKPKVQCPNCGESFTRMDALKRHQAKQHH